MNILPLNPLVCDPTASQEAIAFCNAFNAGFDIVVTMGIVLLPVVAAIRLVQRS